MFQEAQQQQPKTPASSKAATPNTTATSARKEWRQHGSGLTQELEDKRLRLEEQGLLTVRVVSTEARRDVAGKQYTAYVLRVQLPANKEEPILVEHRYSDFSKLNEVFKANNVQVGITFPSKHWAGRMGNWTPSLKWAPEQAQELIDYRKIQLDIWLVHVIELYNQPGGLPHAVATAVYEFLTICDRPPCEQDNTTKSAGAISWNNPLSFTLGSSIRQATATLDHMCCGKAVLSSLHGNSDQSIPLDLLQCAKGLCFLTVIKGGLVVSGRVGTGLLITRLADRWSAPCALGTVGMGWGMLAGADITHYLVVLTTHEAVDSILQGTVNLGADLGVSIGPLGRGANSSVSASGRDWSVHSAYAYAHSQGLFVGMSLEGSVLTTRGDVNAKFYGRQIEPDQIMDLPCPKAADPLYQALDRAMAQEIPQDGFRPSQLWQKEGQQNSHGSGTTFSHPPPAKQATAP